MNTCKKCGKPLDKGDRLLCDECLLQTKSEGAVRMRTCIDCGCEFLGGARAWRCPECRIIRNRETKAAYQKRGAARKLGSTDICKRCGAEYTVVSGRQMYCPECAIEAVREKNRVDAIAKYRENADEINAKRRETRHHASVCEVCGKPFSGMERPGTNYCSDECAEKMKKYGQAIADYKRGKRKSVPRDPRKGLTERICIDCGKTFFGRTSSKRCVECTASHNKEYMREYQKTEHMQNIIKKNLESIRAKYADGIPQSGVRGVAFFVPSERWGVYFQGRYHGYYKDLDEAIEKRRELESSLPPKPRKPRAKSNKPPKPPKSPKPGNPLSPDFRAAKQSGVKGVNWVAYRERWRVAVKGKTYGEYKNLEDALRKRAEIKIKEGI